MKLSLRDITGSLKGIKGIVGFMVQRVRSSWRRPRDADGAPRQ